MTALCFFFLVSIFLFRATFAVSTTKNFAPPCSAITFSHVASVLI